MLDHDTSVRTAYRAHGPELYRYCLRSLNDVGQAEDAVQEVFVRAWRHQQRFDPTVASFRTWLFAIARNVVIDALRARSSRPRVVATPSDDMLHHDDHAGHVDLRLQLQQQLSRLSVEQRQAVVEVIVKGRSSQDLATELGTSDSTVRSRVFYGLKAMRGALAPMERSDA